MQYSKLVDAFQKIEATTRRLEITAFLVQLIKQTPPETLEKVVYLIRGSLYPDYLGVELGIAEKLAIKAISTTTGSDNAKVTSLYKAEGDLGTAVDKLLSSKTQVALSDGGLTVEDVYNGLTR